jgi:transposase
MTKEPGRRVPRSNLEQVRRDVVDAVRRGVHPEDAAKAFNVGRSTAFGWLKMAADGGLEALAVKPSGGSESKLSQRQLDKLVKWLVGSNPRQLQFDFALWTREMVRVLIEREFGVRYTPQGVGRLLARLGFSPQRPLVRAYQQDPQRVREWKECEYPRIRALAAEEGATILFQDEAGVRTDYHTGTTWAPVGQTPVVRGTGARLSVNMISAVTPRGKLYFKVLEGSGNSANFIAFLTDLLHDIEGKLFIIVDGHPSHRSKAVKKFVEDHKDRLSLFFLPPYSPELNPDEWVWKSIKHDGVGRAAARTRDEMLQIINQRVERLKSAPELIAGFFRSPDLAYISA